MAFAVEPYIFDWIFFDDSSLSKLGGFNHTKVGNKMSTQGRISYYRLARYVRYISGVGVCVAYSCEGQPRPRCWISKCSACAFLWTYPEIRTCSIDDWWHSSLRGKQRHTTRNWRCNGPNPSAKPTKSLSAAFIPHSKKRF